VAAERRKKMRTRGALIAAGIVLVLAISGVVIFTSTLNPWKAGPETQKAMAITVIPYSTLRGEVRVEQLPDGSQMNIDADSAVVGRFGPVGRQVEVQKGRALFRVNPDEKRSFVVVVRGRSIVALGTRFDVNVLARGLIVTLLEGHVVIDTKQPGKSPVVLVSGQQYVERGGEGTVRNVTDGEKIAAWRTGVIAFDETPLAEAVQVMNRYTLKRYDIPDPAVGKLVVSGEFHAVDEKAFTAALAEQLDVKANSEGGVIELTRD
jgi:transmembrane sensor